ncbi:MAG: hypothetical protein ACFE91_10565 [Promethearchaeota archaeon]
MLKIVINNSIRKISSDCIGIDMGQSLSKIAYRDDNELELSIFPTQTCISDVKNFLNSKKERYKLFNFTGGRSYKLYIEYSKEVRSNLINEFKANLKGIEFLHYLEKRKELSRSLIVTIGTGTSIILKNDNFLHLGGSALGGGFFMGIIKVLFNTYDFERAINLANKGNRYNLDLKVSDIYDPNDKRIDRLFREFTAASLGKIDNQYEIKTLKEVDFINSIICIIGENLGTIANAFADIHNVKEIVFCGGFLKENKTLKKVLSLLCKLNSKKAIFLKNSEFCAAIGALVI